MLNRLRLGLIGVHLNCRYGKGDQGEIWSKDLMDYSRVASFTGIWNS